MDKTSVIKRFFSETGPSYDKVVHYFTLGIDTLWKNKIIAGLNNPRSVLDLACGTGILTFLIAKKFPISHVTGVDISEGYLNVAKAKARALNAQNVTFHQCRAEDFLSNERFDAIVTSYLPKYTDISILIPHISAMLAPGGVMIFHDFTYPTNSALKAIFHGYFKLIQPLGGWIYPEWRPVFMELPSVIRETNWVKETQIAMDREGLTEVQTESLTLQGSAMVSAKKRFP